MAKTKKKHLSTVEIVAARMKAHEGCESTSVQTRSSNRAAVRKERMASVTNQYGQESRAVRRGLVFISTSPKNRLKGPRGLRALKQAMVTRAVNV